MKMVVIVGFFALLASSVPAGAQEMSAGATGDQSHTTRRTWEDHGWYDVHHDNWDYDVSHAQGGTARTTTRNYQTMLQGTGGDLTANTGLIAPQSIDNSPIGRQSFYLGFPTGQSGTYKGAYRAGFSAGELPYVSTGAVDIDCVDDVAGGVSSGSPGSGAGSGGSGSEGSSGEQLPPAPGEGYQPMYQHGQFVGWYSPEEIALSKTDFPAALRSIVNSDRYYGGELGRLSILYEIGDISSPFPGM